MDDIYMVLSRFEDLVEKCIEETVGGGLEGVDMQCGIGNLYKIQYANTILFRYASGGVFDCKPVNENILDVVSDIEEATYTAGLYVSGEAMDSLADAARTVHEAIRMKMVNE